MSSLGIIALTPAAAHSAKSRTSTGQRLPYSLSDAAVALAASKAGATGIVNVEFIDTSVAETIEEISSVCRQMLTIAGGNNCGIKCDITQIDQLKPVWKTFAKRVEHEDFAAACEAVKERANHRVEASLFKRGIGYSHPAVKIFMPAGAPAPIYADYTEHYPPETAAASLWLRNRDPARWRDRIEHTGADGGPIVVASALEEARRRAAIDVPFTPVSNQTQLPASAEKPLNEAKPSIADALKAKRQG